MAEQRPMTTSDAPGLAGNATPRAPAATNTDAASVQATEQEKQARIDRARTHMQEHRAIEDHVRSFHTHYAESDAATDAMLADFDRLKAENFPEPPPPETRRPA